MNKDESQDLFDKPRNVNMILRVFYLVAAVSVLLDFIFHRHVVHPLESWPGFYGVYGFLACVALVLAAKQLRKLIMRGEDYFDTE